MAVKRDVTEHLRVAEEKARLEEQLRQAQKMEAIGRLAGGVAHDFNNLTAIVLGYGEMLLGQLPPDATRANMGRADRDGRTALGRADPPAPGVQPASRRCSPRCSTSTTCLRNLEKMLGRLIGEDVALTFDLAADLGRVTADPGQIEQVVTNLVVNARDAMPGAAG